MADPALGLRRFSTTRMRPGYAIEEVDALIVLIEQTLARRAEPGSEVTADSVRHAQFSTTRLKPGYDQLEVDQALDRYERDLRELQERPA